MHCKPLADVLSHRVAIDNCESVGVRFPGRQRKRVKYEQCQPLEKSIVDSDFNRVVFAEWHRQRV